MCCDSHQNRMPLPTRAEVAAREARLREINAGVLAAAERRAEALRVAAAERILREAGEVVRQAPVFVGGELVGAGVR